MGIRFFCEHCHQQLNVKSHQAGKDGICPKCENSIRVPTKSTVLSRDELAAKKRRKAKLRGLRQQHSQSRNDSNGIEKSEILKEEAAAASKHPAGDPAHPPDSTKTPPSRPGNRTPSSSESDFLLDKPVNPWLEPNAPNPIETGLGKVWYIRHSELGEQGPIKGKQIQEMLNAQQIRPDSHVWREDWEDWIRADVLFKSLAHAGDADARNRLFNDPDAPIAKSYKRKVNAGRRAKTRDRIWMVVAIVVGSVTIVSLGWLLTRLW